MRFLHCFAPAALSSKECKTVSHGVRHQAVLTGSWCGFAVCFTSFYWFPVWFCWFLEVFSGFYWFLVWFYWFLEVSIGFYLLVLRKNDFSSGSCLYLYWMT